MKTDKRFHSLQEFDEVHHPILGTGTVVGFKGQAFVMIEWDEDPPIDYNMGVNPSIMFPSELTYSAKLSHESRK